jgi:phosphatidylinositol alpha-mannosyltransferase
MRRLRGRLDVRLVVAGARGPFEEEWVSALGPVSQERLPALYAAADAFCAPSLGGESFGYTLIEAMAAGCPVVASDLPGYREASAGAARLVSRDDPAALAAALEEVLSDPAVAASLAERGRRRAAELDWAVLVDRVLDGYRLAMAARGS